jgi:hypothetical protein
MKVGMKRAAALGLLLLRGVWLVDRDSIKLLPKTQ